MVRLGPVVATFIYVIGRYLIKLIIILYNRIILGDIDLLFGGRYTVYGTGRALGAHLGTVVVASVYVPAMN